jgi:hypothetical protein
MATPNSVPSAHPAIWFTTKILSMWWAQFPTREIASYCANETLNPAKENGRCLQVSWNWVKVPQRVLHEKRQKKQAQISQ